MKAKNLLVFLSASLLLVGCNDKNEEPSEQQIESSVWTTYATSKVIKSASRNNDFFNLGTTLNVSMMREEYESGQIQITSNARQKVIIEYSDLTCGDKIFPKEKMSVYLQKYIKLDRNEHSSSKQFFYSGDYIPDMLLPYELAVEADENYVEKDSNQGITIDFDSYGIEAGLYTGSVTIKVGETTYSVPVNLNVWDFAFEGKSSFQTCWLVYNDELFCGELDSTDEMMDTYCDFLAKYKANPYCKVGGITPEDFVEDVERMWSIKNFNSAVIPCSFVANYEPTANCSECRFIKALVRASNKNDDDGGFDNAAYFTNPNNYLKYAVTYMGAYDEADINKAANDAGVKNFFKPGGSYSQLLEMVIGELESEGFFTNKSSSVAADIKRDIRNIPCVFTNNAGVQTDWVGHLNATFCPIENLLARRTDVERYIDGSRLSNNKYWNYTCCNPYYPYPSHHIDDDCLSMRVLGWMDRSYNVSGYLYYEANMNSYHELEGINVDAYETGLRNGGIAGDGFMMYPGLRYGSKTPFPSNRLITYRDGLEDYDMLELYENMLKNAAAKYGINDLNTSIYVQDIYDELFSNGVSYEDHSLVFKMREVLAERILTLKNDDDLFYRYVSSGNENKLEVYSNKKVGYEDGSKRLTTNTVTGGYRYDFVLGTESKTISISLGDSLASLKNHKINALGYKNILHLDKPENIGSNENSTITIKENELTAKIVSEYKDKGTTIGTKTKNFYPSVKFFNTKLEGAKMLKLDYANLTSDADIDFEITFTNSSGKLVKIESHFCSSGLSKSMLVNLSKIKGLTGDGMLEIRFTNYTFDGEEPVLCADRDISISNVALYY